jgi:uncharacterized protein
MEFIGRKEETAILSKALESDSFSSTLVYGRRRVGKTELIRHCLKNAKGRIIPFQAGKTLYETNFASLVSAVSSAYMLPLSFPNLKELLSFIGERAKKEKTILVIDEYSYFREADGSTDSVLQSFIDEYQHESRLSIVLSGSIVRVMKGLIEADAPLYGRFNNVIALAPFDYLEASEFYKERTPEEKLFLYATFGGIPHYLLMLDKSETVEENLIRLLFGVNAALKGEAETLLNDELSAIANASAVLSLLGNKALHYKDINQLYPSSSGNGATYILNKLLEIGLLKKSLSLEGQGDRNALYEIADPFLRFYYAFYLPTRSLSLLYSPKELYSRFVRPYLNESYLPRFYEEVARQFLISENKKGRLEEPLLGLGRYAYSRKDPETGKRLDGEFDVVTKDRKGYIDYECKYLSKPLSLKEMALEERSVLKSGLSFYRLGFFSKNGFEKEALKESKYLLYTLDDIYKY